MMSSWGEMTKEQLAEVKILQNAVDEYPNPGPVTQQNIERWYKIRRGIYLEKIERLLPMLSNMKALTDEQKTILKNNIVKNGHLKRLPDRDGRDPLEDDYTVLEEIIEHLVQQNQCLLTTVDMLETCQKRNS